MVRTCRRISNLGLTKFHTNTELFIIQDFTVAPFNCMETLIRTHSVISRNPSAQLYTDCTRDGVHGKCRSRWSAVLHVRGPFAGSLVALCMPWVSRGAQWRAHAKHRRGGCGQSVQAASTPGPGSAAGFAVLRARVHVREQMGLIAVQEQHGPPAANGSRGRDTQHLATVAALSWA